MVDLVKWDSDSFWRYQVGLEKGQSERVSIYDEKDHNIVVMLQLLFQVVNCLETNSKIQNQGVVRSYPLKLL